MNAEQLKKWRKDTKKRIIDSMGGECQCCGYKASLAALCLHHLNSDEKEFSIGPKMSTRMLWSEIVPELRKCVLVCKNCHMEIHDNITKLSNYKTFDEAYAVFDEYMGTCQYCKNKCRTHSSYCSLTCSRNSQRKIDWSKIDLKDRLKTTTMASLAKELKISPSVLRRNIKKQK